MGSRRLVGVDVFGGDHRVELHAEAGRSVVEEHRSVDVRQDDQLGVLLERAQRVSDVVEHRPVVEAGRECIPSASSGATPNPRAMSRCTRRRTSR